MQLTRYTDYAIRVLLHVGARDEADLSSVQEIARVYGISKDHLKKVVQDLSQGGFLTAIRGRNGGLKLGRDAEKITIGQIVRHTETGFEMVDCSSCLVAPACSLPRVLNEATNAFLSVLDRYTLADILSKRADLQGLFGGAGSLKSAVKRVGSAADNI
jgi:Rrf2 family transcriptional regulator, nitric oxide-sensitive transcriptional repressor